MEKKENKSYSEMVKNKEFSCQICQVQEAVLEIKGSWYLSNIQGKFCENCAVVRIRAGNNWTTEKVQAIRVEMGMKVMGVSEYVKENELEIKGSDFMKVKNSQELPQLSPEFLKKNNKKEEK